MPWKLGQSFLDKLIVILSLEEELAEDLGGEGFGQKEPDIQGILKN